MRQFFNQANLWEKLRTGELRAVVKEERHPALVQAREPYCTRSQMLSYLDDNGNEVARVHQYLRPDGQIGASGKPDPKRLLLNGTLYRLKKAQ